jgi:Ca2+-binding EF-hand superfamily protein
MAGQWPSLVHANGNLKENPMQKYTKIALFAAASLVVIGGAAVANQGWKHGFRGHGPTGIEEMSERYDANKDGKISQEEIDANRTSWLTEFDGDKSGALALGEFQNLWLKARNQQMVREFQQFDRDGNGQVTLDEYKLPLSKIVAEMDQDKDNALSNDELSPRRHWGMKRHGGMGPGQDEQPDAQPDAQ